MTRNAENVASEHSVKHVVYMIRRRKENFVAGRQGPGQLWRGPALRASEKKGIEFQVGMDGENHTSRRTDSHRLSLEQMAIRGERTSPSYEMAKTTLKRHHYPAISQAVRATSHLFATRCTPQKSATHRIMNGGPLTIP